MFLLATLLVSAGIGTIIYSIDGHTIIKNTVQDKYRKFRQVNMLVQTQYKSACQIICVSIQLIAKMYWINFLQRHNNTVKRINRKTATITYVLDGRKYTMTVKPPRGPSPVLLVFDENENDVTDMITPFLGPNNNWHHHHYTPSFWDKNNLTFELYDGTEKTFSKDDVINLL